MNKHCLQPKPNHMFLLNRNVYLQNEVTTAADLHMPTD